MVQVFPTCLFGFLEKEVDIERQTLKGGTALSGEQDKISTDGGGRVFAEFAAGSLVDRHVNLAWRAIVTQLEEGVTPMVVPFCDSRHTPYGSVVSGPGGSVPHSDQTPFSDDTLYQADAAVASVADAAALRATTLRVNMQLAQPLIGGEWFSIQHPGKNWRAYRIGAILEQSDTSALLQFRTPLRGAVTPGMAVDFINPRCLMVADMRPSTRVQNGRYGEAAIRFVEAP